jgi:hypothetical protein
MDRSTVAERLSRTPPAPTGWFGSGLQVRGLGRHGFIFFVGPPRRNYGYAIGEPPRIWSRGAPNAARPHSSATC